MTIERLRNVGKVGIITDLDPYDLPMEAFSAGVNVRFRNNKITGAPVFRDVFTLGTTDPRFAYAISPTQGVNDLFIGFKNGTIAQYANGATTNYTLAGYTPSVVEATWSATTVDSVVYINRSDRAPWYLLPAGTAFQNLGVVSGAPAQWDSTWTTALIRQCANALVALNVTKGATNYPNLVKTSAPVTTGAIPTSWDQTVASTLATENTLGSMDGPIVDACPLGQDLIIYGQREAWRMHADGSLQIYSYNKLPFKKGSLNANCSVEIDGKNYVFGMNDIWVHDGVSEDSLCDQKVRDFIFNSLNLSQSYKCHVTYNPRLNEIYFAYVSGDAYVNFQTQNGVDGCNRQAVYNITNNSWTFDDLPSTWFAAYAPLPNFQTYASTPYTYTNVGGSYQDQEDGGKRVICMVGSLNTFYGLSTELYAFDVYGDGSVAAFPVDQNATAARYLERIGIDLNELNAELRGYKVISTIYPQARVDVSGGTFMMISVGASDSISSLTTSNWSPYVPYDGATQYKLDFNIAGRWLGIRLKWADYRALTITGFDLDIKVTGNR